MASPKVKLKRSSTAGSVPLTTDLELGEIALNTYDGKAYFKKDDGTESIVEIGTGSGLGGSYTAPQLISLYNKNGGGSSASFDGVETRFQLRNTAGGIVDVASALSLCVSLNGVIQQPNTGTPSSFDGFYIIDNTTSGSDIVFSEAPASADDFFGVLGGQFTSISGTSAVTRLDDISSGFDGVETDFILTKNSSTYTPQYPVGVIVVLGGVVQTPTDSYSISGSNISFTAAPPSGTTFYAIDLKIGAPLTEELVLTDKNIELNAVVSPSDANADGGGLTLKATTNKTFNWIDSTDSWTSSENIDLASGKTYKIGGTEVLSASALGGTVQITSANITDGTIVDGDISATAEIAVSKLANGTANQLIQTDAAGTGVEFTSNIDIPGTLDVTSNATFDANVTIEGDLTVNGTTTTIDTETLLVEDKNIEMGVVGTPTDTTADGGGITLRGTVNKTFNWVNSTDSWTSSENIDLASTKTYKIAGTDVLSATGLGSNVTGSSLTSVGNLTGLTVDTNTLVVDATNNRVGIGTATPATTLEIKSDANAQTAAAIPTLRITNDDGSAVYNDITGSVEFFTEDSSDPNLVSAYMRNISETGAGVNYALAFGTKVGTGADATEKLRIDSSGRLLVGTSTALNVDGNAGFQGLQVAGAGSAGCASLSRFTNNANSSDLTFAKSRGTTVGTNAIVANNDDIGAIRFSAADGTTYLEAARILAEVDGTPGQAAGTFEVGTEYRILTTGTTDFTLIGAADSNPGTVFTATGAGTGTGTAILTAGDMPGRLVFSTTADGASSPTARMTIKADGKVGIGTASPSKNLEVVSAGSDIALLRRNNASGGAGLYLSNNSNNGAALLSEGGSGGGFVIYTQSSDVITPRMRIDSSGNVGIGTVSPSAPLQVQGSAGEIRMQRPTASQSDWSMKLTSSSGEYQIYDNNNTTARLTIDSSGRLGVGTSLPDNLLEVDAGTGSDAGITIRMGTANSGANDSHISFQNSAGSQIFRAEFENSTPKFKIFSDQASDAFTILRAGNVGIGTESPGDYSASANNLVISESANAGITVVSGTSNTGNLFFADGTAGNAAFRGYVSYNHANDALSFASSAQERARIDSLGRLLVGATSFDGPTKLVVRGNSSVVTGSGNAYLVRGESSADMADNDIVGILRFGDQDDNRCAQIQCSVDGTPSATAMPGDLSFWTTAASAVAPTQRMTITSNGDVGIGVTAPATRLHLQGALGPTLRFERNDTSVVAGDSFGSLEFESNDSTTGCAGILGKIECFAPNTLDGTSTNGGALRFFTSTTNPISLTERMRITSAGNVGISTTSPAGTLSIGPDEDIVFGNQASTGTTGTGRLVATGGEVYIQAGLAATSGSNAPLVVTGYGGVGERLRIDSSGRLLVGTSTSLGNALLQIQDNAAGSDKPASIILSRGRTSYTAGQDIGSIDFTDGSGNIYTQILAETDGTSGTDDYPGRLGFYTTADASGTPTERMRIEQDGTVKIGFGSTNAGRLRVQETSTWAATFNRNTTNGDVIELRRSDVAVGSISVTTSATAYNTSSDYRLKENVVPLTGAVDRLNQLQVHRFNFIADPDKTVDGFLAHEAQTVVPECVTGEKDAVDEDGNPQYQGIDQSKLVPLLTAALQEALAEIESLKARVTALEP